MSHKSPYRVASKRGVPDETPEPVYSDGELVGVFVLVWTGCLAWVVFTLVRHETFDVGSTLAALVVLLLPIVSRGWLRGLVRRKHEHS